MPESFDAAVIARGLGGFICALSLASRGAKVFLAVSRRTAEPQVFYGNGDRGLLRHVFRSIGIWGDAEKRIVHPDIAYQVALPGRRMDIFTHPSQLIKEFIREYPDGKKDIQSLFGLLKERNDVLRAYLLRKFFREQRVKSPGFLIYRKFRREKLSSLFEETTGPRPFIPPLLALTQWWTGTVSQDPFALETAFHVGSLEGAFRMTGGLYTFLKEKLSEHSVTITEGEPLKDIFFKGKTLSGLAIGDVTINSGVLAFDDGVDLILPSLAPPLRAKFSRKPAFLQHSAWEHVFHFLIREQAIPEGMEDEIVYVPAEGEIRGKNLLRIALHRQTPSPKAGMVPLSVGCFTENEHDDISGEIVPALHSLMPFSDEKGNGIIPADDPPEKGPVYNFIHPTQFNPLSFTPRLSLKSLFHCGKALFPSLGIEGEVLAGYYCAQVMSQKM